MREKKNLACVKTNTADVENAVSGGLGSATWLAGARAYETKHSWQGAARLGRCQGYMAIALKSLGFQISLCDPEVRPSQ